MHAQWGENQWITCDAYTGNCRKTVCFPSVLAAVIQLCLGWPHKLQVCTSHRTHFVQVFSTNTSHLPCKFSIFLLLNFKSHGFLYSLGQSFKVLFPHLWKTCSTNSSPLSSDSFLLCKELYKIIIPSVTLNPNFLSFLGKIEDRIVLLPYYMRW
jgi:hypothetical protein